MAGKGVPAEYRVDGRQGGALSCTSGGSWNDKHMDGAGSEQLNTPAHPQQARPLALWQEGWASDEQKGHRSVQTKAQIHAPCTPQSTATPAGKAGSTPHCTHSRALQPL